MRPVDYRPVVYKVNGRTLRSTVELKAYLEAHNWMITDHETIETREATVILVNVASL